MSQRPIAILGSTGSIGTSTLKVVQEYEERFSVELLVAGRQAEALAAQIKACRPRVAGLSDPEAFPSLCQALGVPAGSTRWFDTELLRGDDQILKAIGESSAEIVVAAVVGMAGLSGVLAAIDSGKDIALANKESLVVAGDLVMKRAKAAGVTITPVDSEHSAIFQVLQAIKPGDLGSVILTASGGPFLHTPKDEFRTITPEQALKHPKWNMGAKISIDSATMMNKALEVIEAHWLFEVPSDSIEVIVHPQSIVHSMIRLVDGTVLAQLSVPDMKGPIAYALTYPGVRASRVMEPLDFTRVRELTFLPLDDEKFPSIQRARACLSGANGAPAVLNTANEFAVSSFLARAISFESIHTLIGESLEVFGHRTYDSLEELFSLTKEVTEWSRQYVASIRH